MPKYCSECGEKIESSSKFCPECRYKFSTEDISPTKTFAEKPTNTHHNTLSTIYLVGGILSIVIPIIFLMILDMAR